GRAALALEKDKDLVLDLTPQMVETFNCSESAHLVGFSKIRREKDGFGAEVTWLCGTQILSGTVYGLTTAQTSQWNFQVYQVRPLIQFSGACDGWLSPPLLKADRK